ncbi:hypothetical protein [Thermobifida fusca]|uniref:hypothetical protein n=1 Tax=Thermobifida fusca TaxID=2021 RepID=UPI001877F6C9|nr:hypothetical protein [Thermobifida fusca]QOS59645.1 hypothetical protein IM867_04385 [Thermobifida fusca]
MTKSSPWKDKVHDAFLHRESSAVGAAFQKARNNGNSDRDNKRFKEANELIKEYDLVTHLRRQGKSHDRSPDAVENRLRAMTRLLADDRDLLLAALYSPLALVAAVNERYDFQGAHKQWISWCWTVEAVWRCVARLGGIRPKGFIDVELDILFPVAARQRCVAFLEAYRSLDAIEDRMASAAPYVFGSTPEGDTEHLFTARSIEARRIWVECLDQYESHTVLSYATPAELEQEITALLFDNGDCGPLLGVSTDRLTALDSKHSEHKHKKKGRKKCRMLKQDDKRIMYNLAERHLLPRFRIWDTLRVAMATIDRPWRWIIVVAGLTVAAIGMLSLVIAALVGFPTLTCAAIAAGLCCLLGAIGILAYGRMWALPWLLRMPAAAAIGLFMLTAMHPSWWHAAFGDSLPEVSPGSQPVSPPLGPLWVAILLSAAAYIYLLTTARNNGIKGLSALGRSLMVLLVGALHALMVSLLGLAWVVPVFSENGAELAQGWVTHPSSGVVTLVQATAWCLAAGVFSQILWDDRPITAPLSHTRWRKDV